MTERRTTTPADYLSLVLVAVMVIYGISDYLRVPYLTAVLEAHIRVILIVLCVMIRILDRS